MKYYYLNDDSRLYFAYNEPNVCPICNKSISPSLKHASYNKFSDIISMLFECSGCNKCFISHYTKESITVTYERTNYYRTKLIGSYPKFAESIKFEDSIEKLSPLFCEIYNQALQSESYKLTHLSGIGYRKSLEFLIKDYCIHTHPDKQEVIKQSFLGNVINDYVDSDKIKTLAKASAWLGNDETHYIRKFEDKDINDLKRFIKATVAFVTYELVSEDADVLVNS